MIVCMYERMYACMHPRMYVCLYGCMYVCMYIHTCIHRRTYIHAYISRRWYDSVLANSSTHVRTVCGSYIRAAVALPKAGVG